MATQVPEHDVIHVFSGSTECLIDLEKAVHGAGRVDLQVDVQHTPLLTLEVQPLSALGNRHA